MIWSVYGIGCAAAEVFDCFLWQFRVAEPWKRKREVTIYRTFANLSDFDINLSPFT